MTNKAKARKMCTFSLTNRLFSYHHIISTRLKSYINKATVFIITDIGNGDTAHQTAVVTKQEMTIPKATGEISCRASVGSQSYVVTETILLTDYDTSGIAVVTQGVSEALICTVHVIAYA